MTYPSSHPPPADTAPPGGYKLISWEGVGMFVPSRWEIGRHAGDMRKGFLRVDDDSRIIIQARWWSTARPVPVTRLVEQHARSVAARDRRRLPSFQPTNALTLPGGGNDRAVAFSSTPADAAAGETLVIYQRLSIGQVLMLRVMRENGYPDNEQLNRMLSGLRLQGANESRDWAFHDLAFTTPPGWMLQQDHLYAGVACLEFKCRRDRITLRRFSAADAVMGTEKPGIEDLERWCRVTYAHAFFDMRYRVEPMTDPRGRPGLRLTGSRRLLAPIEMRWLIPRHRRLPRRIDILWDQPANKIYCIEIRRPSPALEPDLAAMQTSLRLNLAPSTDIDTAGQSLPANHCARDRSLNARVQQRQNIRASINRHGRTVLQYRFPRPRKLRWWRWLGGLDAGTETIDKQIELDLIGSLVWQDCARSPRVHQLIATVHHRFRISYREAELSVTEFIRAMGSRGLLSVTLDDPQPHLRARSPDMH